MDDLFLEKVQMQVLDFTTDKRTQWESKHQLYSVIFELTPKCNFNCVHCYLHDHHRSEELPYDEIIRIIDILYDTNGTSATTFSPDEDCTRAQIVTFLYRCLSK